MSTLRWSETSASSASASPPAPAAADDNAPPASDDTTPSASSETTAAESAAPASPEPAREAGAASVQVASGDFISLAHGTTGTAAVVDLGAGERVLTFADLDGDNGPDLRVYLVEGPINGNGDGGKFVDLDDLKGNKQYEIPEGVDVSRFDTVVIWCRAFSVGFGAATLVAS